MKIAVYADNTSQLDNARAYFEKWKRGSDKRRLFLIPG